MARSVTVVVKLADANHTAGVEINAGTLKWEKFEPNSANYVFTTKSGSLRKVGTQTELMRSGGGYRVGRLENFDAKTVVDGATGNGLSDDTGSAITWTVKGIADI